MKGFTATWQAEMLVVAGVLAGVVLSTDKYDSGVEWIGALAVLLSFGHAQVADRLAEAEAQRQPRHFDQADKSCFVYGCTDDCTVARDRVLTVHCHQWAARYLVGKETLWLVYFVMHQSWSALAGVVLFLVYPLWRKWWRRMIPV